MAVVSGFVVSPGCVAGRMSSNAPAAVPETTDRPEPAHLVIPPATEYASKPTLRRKPVIAALRLPVAHTTYTGASLSSSEVRPGNWSIGMSTAPGTCPATYSRGSRTSMIVAPAIAASANWLMSISGLSAGITCVLLAVGVRYPSGYTNFNVRTPPGVFQSGGLACQWTTHLDKHGLGSAAQVVADLYPAGYIGGCTGNTAVGYKPGRLREGQYGHRRRDDGQRGQPSEAGAGSDWRRDQDDRGRARLRGRGHPTRCCITCPRPRWLQDHRDWPSAVRARWGRRRRRRPCQSRAALPFSSLTFG